MEVDLSESDDMLGPSDDEDTLTSAEVLQKLQNAWLNEKMAPELLSPLTEEVVIMLEQLKNVEDNLSRCGPREEKIKHHRLEVERIRFLLADYLRVRLAKIQKFCWYIRDEENKKGSREPSTLMPEEHKFLAEYLKVAEGHLKTVALTNMPPPFAKLDTKSMNVKPNNDSFVFCRVNKESHVVVEEPDGSRESDIKLATGSQYLIKYAPVSSLVNSNDVQLV